MKFSPEIYTLRDYQRAFSQPMPAYGLKAEGQEWKTIHRPLGQWALSQHIAKVLSIASFGRWYPGWGMLDIDNVERDLLLLMLDRLGLRSENSAIFTSESPDSYHVYFRISLQGSSITLRHFAQRMALVNEMLPRRIEIYPSSSRFFRLPFGRGQDWVTPDGRRMVIDHQEGMQLLSQLGEFDLSHLPYAPDIGDTLVPSLTPWGLGLNPAHNVQGWKQAGWELIQSGLVLPASRVGSTFKVAYYHFSQNIPLDITIALTQEWIRTKHNGFSKDWQRHPQRVLAQTSDIVSWLYDHYEQSYYLPDSALLEDQGFITAPLTQQIVQHSQGKLPLMKFGLKLFAYLTIRNVGGNKIGVHRNRLADWSSKDNYLRYIDHFKDAGLLKRDHRYRVGNYAKGISLLTPKTNIDQAIKLDADRPASTLQEIIPRVYSPHDYARQLQALAVNRKTISMQITEIWGEKKPSHIRTKKKTTQAHILQYTQANPKAKQKDIANELGKSTRTIRRNQEKIDNITRIQEYKLKHPEASQRTIAKTLNISLGSVNNALNKK